LNITFYKNLYKGINRSNQFNHISNLSIVNKRLAGGLNGVTKLAKYDYIVRMDTDDLMLPNRIETQLAVFKENPEIDIVTTGVFSTLNNLTLKGVRGQSYNEATFKDIISLRRAVTHASIIAKKSWYERW